MGSRLPVFLLQIGVAQCSSRCVLLSFVLQYPKNKTLQNSAVGAAYSKSSQPRRPCVLTYNIMYTLCPFAPAANYVGPCRFDLQIESHVCHMVGAQLVAARAQLLWPKDKVKFIALCVLALHMCVVAGVPVGSHDTLLPWLLDTIVGLVFFLFPTCCHDSWTLKWTGVFLVSYTCDCMLIWLSPVQWVICWQRVW